MFFKSLLSIAFIFAPSAVFAAACCGGGFAAPSIIAGDDRAQMTTSASYSELAADVYTNGLWRKRKDTETNETFRIEGAHIFKDRFQAGASLPIVRRARGEEKSSGLGDINATLGYEYLPDWSYNPWRPKGIGYLQLVVPTGKSIYESDETYGLDSRGRGLWALGAGTLLTKIIRRYDVFATFDFHRAFAKDVSGGTVHPGWGGNLGTGVGYNLEKYRFGTSITWSYEDPIDFTGSDPTQTSDGVLQRFATVGVVASYLASDDWTASATYSDQTVAGSPVNTSLSRTVMLLLQRRWER